MAGRFHRSGWVWIRGISSAAAIRRDARRGPVFENGHSAERTYGLQITSSRCERSPDIPLRLPKFNLSFRCVHMARSLLQSAIRIGRSWHWIGALGIRSARILARPDDWPGRRQVGSWLVPAGLGIAALSAGALMFQLPTLASALTLTVLSLGYDMTQPLFAGIVTSLNPKRAGQAMGLNVFTLFVGFGIGSYVFGETLRWGFPTTIAIFAGVQMIAALAAFPLFRSEIRFSSVR